MSVWLSSPRLSYVSVSIQRAPDTDHTCAAISAERETDSADQTHERD